jgi:predicted dehydrogenase
MPDESLDGLPIEEDLEKALEQFRPNIVLVTNPTAHHLDVAIPAARAGCHLFIEKPISNLMDRIDELESALAAGGGKALIGYHFRYSPGLRFAKSLIDEGAIGRPIQARVYWGEYLPDWHPWEDYRNSYSARADLGGGVVLTLSHPYDYLRWLFGEVDEVLGTTGNSGSLELEVEDHASALLTMANGTLASVQLDYIGKPPAHYLEVTGSDGSLRWDAISDHVRWWSEEVDEWQQRDPPSDFERNSMYLDEMRHLLAIDAGEEEPLCTLRDGIQALEIALAIHRSALDKASVKLSPIVVGA